jgi:hypothetical protein
MRGRVVVSVLLPLHPPARTATRRPNAGRRPTVPAAGGPALVRGGATRPRCREPAAPRVWPVRGQSLLTVVSGGLPVGQKSRYEDSRTADAGLDSASRAAGSVPSCTESEKP